MFTEFGWENQTRIITVITVFKKTHRTLREQAELIRFPFQNPQVKFKRQKLLQK